MLNPEFQIQINTQGPINGQGSGMQLEAQVEDPTRRSPAPPPPSTLDSHNDTNEFNPHSLNFTPNNLWIFKKKMQMEMMTFNTIIQNVMGRDWECKHPKLSLMAQEMKIMTQAKVWCECSPALYESEQQQRKDYNDKTRDLQIKWGQFMMKLTQFFNETQ